MAPHPEAFGLMFMPQSWCTTQHQWKVPAVGCCCAGAGGCQPHHTPHCRRRRAGCAGSRWATGGQRAWPPPPWTAAAACSQTVTGDMIKPLHWDEESGCTAAAGLGIAKQLWYSLNCSCIASFVDYILDVYSSIDTVDAGVRKARPPSCMYIRMQVKLILMLQNQVTQQCCVGI